ncbi:hypothetical protein NDU88_002944 [Pleurodeles waltl]|uniref:Uncharacterized protein n=1 Tax=Pleurodeles waltl TaxID=8319 RepID=A0AAV7T3Q4_PLEWA|nr:hypothetical protein NDU88_002944 [Pleurodeles waltl]
MSRFVFQLLYTLAGCARQQEPENTHTLHGSQRSESESEDAGKERAEQKEGVKPTVLEFESSRYPWHTDESRERRGYANSLFLLWARGPSLAVAEGWPQSSLIPVPRPSAVLIAVADLHTCHTPVHLRTPLPVPTALALGKHKAKQSKLSFETRHLIRQVEQGQDSKPAMEHPEDDGTQEIDLREFLRDIKSSQKTLDTKLDLLTNRLDRVKQRMDKHEIRLDHLENCVSDAMTSR